MTAGSKSKKSKKSNTSNSSKKKNSKSTDGSVVIADEKGKSPLLLLLLAMFLLLAVFALLKRGTRGSIDDAVNEKEEDDTTQLSSSTVSNTNYTKSAKLLAEFINSGPPLDNSNNIQQLQELINSNKDVLGELITDEATGYRVRRGSFLELLNETPPRRIKEDDLSKLNNANSNDIDSIASLFRRPLIIDRSKSKSMSKLAKHLTVSKLKNAKLTVKPSRCSTLALNYGLFDSIIDKKSASGSGSSKTINPLLQPNHPNYKGVSFTHYLQMGMDHHHHNREEDSQSSTFDLTTSALDDKNIQIQTHGIQSYQLSHFDLQSTLTKNELHHPHMDQEYFPSTCINPPALGMAGSLRGLRFHNHPANWNESIIGRKLWLLYPTRDHVNYSSHDNCPWPPWSTAGNNDPNIAMKTMMDTFFMSDKHTPSSLLNAINEPIKSCHDQTLTSLQWIVYEMPKLPHKHRPLLFIAHPNELVWIPDGWIHATLNIDDVVHAYRASCMQNVYHGRISNEDAYKDTLELCKETDKFCPNRDEYCHSYCQSCDDGRDNIICNIDVDDDGSEEELVQQQDEL